MRYRAAEKLEIIRLVEQSSLSVRRTLAQLGIPRATFYLWYERYLARGAGALEGCVATLADAAGSLKGSWIDDDARGCREKHPITFAPLAVKIVGSNPNDIYTVEYRQADGWDQGLVVNSVFIHEYKVGASPYSFL